MVEFVNSYWILLIPITILIAGLIGLFIGIKKNIKNLIIISSIFSSLTFAIICYLIFIAFMIHFSMKPLDQI